jgi:hypothetical protein
MLVVRLLLLMVGGWDGDLRSSLSLVSFLSTTTSTSLKTALDVDGLDLVPYHVDFFNSDFTLSIPRPMSIPSYVHYSSDLVSFNG